jgi:hypothetical protein
MRDAHYFDEDAVIEGEADDAVHEMARRQFGMSLAVGLALLAGAGLMAVRVGPQAPANSVEMAARHRIIRVEAPQTQVAGPSQQAPVRIAPGPDKG